MIKSRLLKKIIDDAMYKCETRDDMTVDGVMVETLSCLLVRYYGNSVPEGVEEDDFDELDSVKDLIDSFNVNYGVAASELKDFSYSGITGDGADAHALYVDALSAFEEYDGTVTLERFLREVFKNPSAAIAACVMHGESAPVADNTGSASEGASGRPDGGDGGDLQSMLEEQLRMRRSRFTTEEPQTRTANGNKPATIAEIARRAKEVHAYLSSTVFGQDVAVNTFVSGYFQAELTAITDKSRFRPRATFLFAGPPGVGKTFLSEQVAKVLKLPFMRFDMSEYSENEANIEFCGSDKVYKNGKAGNVTSFVADNPNAILLFDEVEKAHLNVIHLFLQILDAGRLRDNYTDEEVSFKDTIIIFTTNAGKGLYEDERVNLSTVSRKTVIKALSADINPVTNAPMFPAAICSRFAYGNVVMFNRMGANYLLQIAERELKRQVEGIESGTGIKITCDPLLPYAIIYAEGGVADARTVKGKSGAYIFNELYELFRLMQSEKNGYDIGAVKSVNIKLQLPEDKKIVSLFCNDSKPAVLVFADGETAEKCRGGISCADVFCASSQTQAEEILDKENISVILCDVACGVRGENGVLNIEDVDSAGRDFMYYAAERSRVNLYVLENKKGDISDEEFASLAAMGAKGTVSLSGGDGLDGAVAEICATAYQQTNLNMLGRANKVLTHKTLQRVSEDGSSAEIALFDFKLSTALDAGDNGSVLDGVSKPKTKFDDVIGANDAKEELAYFIEYLKNASKFVKRGVRAPKGILLYGPPGTGKTLLAKAMAGESDVTFIRAEGNQFLKKYVGEGSESVHKLFNTARKYAPSILFIDEIDAIAKSRGDDFNRSDDVLTSFLTEMDGFNTDPDRPVFVLAATNFDIEQGSNRSLDAALLRRFDRKIYVDLPNKDERVRFLNLKLEKTAGNTVSGKEVENIASRSTGASLADLDSVFELALRNLFKSQDGVLTDEMLEEAFETFNSGSVKKWSESELLRTARHEAGHALACYLGGETPSYLTIVARGSHGGYMQHADSEGKGTYTKKELLSRVRTALGGRAAEVVYYGEEDGVSTGASGDLRSATSIIENMICYYGMDDVAGLGSIDVQKLTSSPYYTQVLARVNELLSREMNYVKELIAQNKKAIDGLVDALMEKNSLKTEEIEAILSKTVKK